MAKHALDAGGFPAAPRTPSLLGLERWRGDLWAPNSAGVMVRVPAGPIGSVLTPDPAQPSGLKWVTSATAPSPCTNKGDIFGFDTGNARIPVGPNGTFISADSAQALGVKYSGIGGPIDAAYGWYEWDDFLNGYNAGGGSAINTKSFAVSSGTASGVSLSPNLASHPGALILSTGTTNAGSVIIAGAGFTATSGQAGNLPVFNASVPSDVRFIFRIPTLSNGTDRFTIIIGWSDTPTSHTASNSMVATLVDNVNSGAFQLVPWVAAVKGTPVNGSTVIVGNTWYWGRLHTNTANTQTDFYLSTNGGTENLECSYTGTPPTSGVGYGVFFRILKSVGVSSLTAHYDRWDAQQLFGR